MVHYEIEPIKAYVHESILYDEDKTKNNMIACTIFAISAYKNEVLTFGIVLDDGSVFFYIPPHKINVKGKTPKYNLKDIVYHNCESETITINKFKELNKDKVNVYLKYKDKWVKGKYKLTIDWYKGNDLLHMVELKTGELVFLPSHKLKFNNTKKEFKPYVKMHNSWKV